MGALDLISVAISAGSRQVGENRGRPSPRDRNLPRIEVMPERKGDLDPHTWVSLLERFRPGISEEILSQVDTLLTEEGYPNRLSSLMPRFPYFSEKEKKRFERKGIAFMRVGPVMVVFDRKGELVPLRPLAYHTRFNMFVRLLKAGVLRRGFRGTAVLPPGSLSLRGRETPYTARDVVAAFLERGDKLLRYIRFVSVLVHEVMHGFNSLKELPTGKRTAMLWEIMREASSILAIESLGWWYIERKRISERMFWGNLKVVLASRHGVSLEDVEIEEDDPPGWEEDRIISYKVKRHRNYVRLGDIRSDVEQFSHRAFLVDWDSIKHLWDYMFFAIDGFRVLGLDDIKIAKLMYLWQKKNKVTWDESCSCIPSVNKYLEELMRSRNLNEKDLKALVEKYREEIRDRSRKVRRMIVKAISRLAFSDIPQKFTGIVYTREEDAIIATTTVGVFQKVADLSLSSGGYIPENAIVEVRWSHNSSDSEIRIFVPPNGRERRGAEYLVRLPKDKLGELVQSRRFKGGRRRSVKL